MTTAYVRDLCEPFGVVTLRRTMHWMNVWVGVLRCGAVQFRVLLNLNGIRTHEGRTRYVHYQAAHQYRSAIEDAALAAHT